MRPAPPWYLAICAIFRDEAAWLREWIEFHREVGVEHFLLYDNGSSDNYSEVLCSYGPDLVTVVNWPDRRSEVARVGWTRASQMPAYADAIRAMRGKCEWLGLVDVDEFLVPIRDPDLPSFLKGFEPYGGVVLNWLCFGTSGVWDLDEGELLLERLCERGPWDEAENHKVKSIVRPHCVSPSPHVHSFEFISDYYAVDALGRRHTGRSTTAAVELSVARIHHYKNRTRRYFCEQKIRKKEHMSGLTLTGDDVAIRQRAHSGTQDRTMYRFVPRVRERIAGLSGPPDPPPGLRGADPWNGDA